LYACVCASLMERFGDGNVGFLEVWGRETANRVGIILEYDQMG
jgi:hypothetical protein